MFHLLVCQKNQYLLAHSVDGDSGSPRRLLSVAFLELIVDSPPLVVEALGQVRLFSSFCCVRGTS